MSPAVICPSSRTARSNPPRHRMEIRAAFGFRECTQEDQVQLAQWLAAELCPVELNRDRLAAAVVARCRKDRLEPPAPARVTRLVASAVNTFEEGFCATVERLSAASRSRLDDLVAEDDGDEGSVGTSRPPVWHSPERVTPTDGTGTARRPRSRKRAFLFAPFGREPSGGRLRGFAATGGALVGRDPGGVCGSRRAGPGSYPGRVTRAPAPRRATPDPGTPGPGAGVANVGGTAGARARVPERTTRGTAVTRHRRQRGVG
ncbi:DUF4158 domain-containing protein [Streptomyces sp. NPDC058439]|uniref:DUF4158 domain-containing protein n=1 Tax=Streptomyces sp. NPDC058439 TaxID=3346500 RepID=UPI00365CCBE1